MIVIVIIIILFLIYLNFYNKNENFYQDTTISNKNIDISKNLILSNITNNISLSSFLNNRQNINSIENEINEINKINEENNEVLIKFPKFYPISTNFDPVYNNYNNLLENSSISIINTILENTINKSNKESHIIYFNPSLKQTKHLELKEDDIIKFGIYFINIMNSIATSHNSFVFKNVYPISKEQIENQIRINFHIELIYNYPKSKKKSVNIVPNNFPLLLNVVLLFEKKYQDEDDFFKNKKENDVSIYVQTLSLLGITNNGYLPGNYTKTQSLF